MAPNVAKVCNETFRSAFSTSFAVTNELFTTASKQYDDINLEGEEEAKEVQATKKSISVSFPETGSVANNISYRQQVAMNSLL